MVKVLKSYEEIYKERLKAENDPEVRRIAKKIPGFVEDCMRICLNGALEKVKQDCIVKKDLGKDLDKYIDAYSRTSYDSMVQDLRHIKQKWVLNWK